MSFGNAWIYFYVVKSFSHDKRIFLSSFRADMELQTPNEKISEVMMAVSIISVHTIMIGASMRHVGLAIAIRSFSAESKAKV